MTTQPQLLHVALTPNDVRFTPDWVARDMISFFQPVGKVLEPCRGEDAIYRYLPEGSEWCEIEKGRDFFSWTKYVDFIISNPPWHAAQFNDWLNHSFDIAPDIVYLLPIHFMFRSASKLRIMKTRGWVKHARYYGTGTEMGFKMGNPIYAMHFQRGYHGDTSWSWYGESR